MREEDAVNCVEFYLAREALFEHKVPSEPIEVVPFDPSENGGPFKIVDSAKSKPPKKQKVVHEVTSEQVCEEQESAETAVEHTTAGVTGKTDFQTIAQTLAVSQDGSTTRTRDTRALAVPQGGNQITLELSQLKGDYSQFELKRKTREIATMYDYLTDTSQLLEDSQLRQNDIVFGRGHCKYCRLS